MADTSMKQKLEDCARPACDQIKSMFMSALQKNEEGKQEKALQCPVGREELGRATWALVNNIPYIILFD
jgi:hypothetical protein